MEISKSIQNAVLGYTPKENSSERLAAGTHKVMLTAYVVLTSRLNWDLTPKAELPEFSDPTPELGIEFKDEAGAVQWHRFNMWGYKRWDELSDTDQADDSYCKVLFHGVPYACKVNGNKKIRIKDSKRTADAQSFVDQFFTSLGMIGVPVQEALDSALEKKIPFTVKLVDDEYNGKAQVKVKGFNKDSGVVASAEGEGDSDEFGD